jgi:peptidoglycan/LPS O-acetylase OafA/YrhL
MALRVLRVGVGSLLGLSGALMYAASWERWAGACPWGEPESGPCEVRQDHLYDFLAPSDPWQPVGDAAQLAGWSLLVLALSFALLPWALTGRRPGRFSAVALVGAVVALVAVGVATLRSGITGAAVQPFLSDWALYLWVLLPPALLVRWAFAARGWAVAAANVLFLSTPLVAAFSYAVGSYDARPWWEAVSGAFIATAGGCLWADAAFRGRFRSRKPADPPVAPAPGHGAPA